MEHILVPHGMTPTGYGIRLARGGDVRALSPCCGRSMQTLDATCKGCHKKYKSFANKAIVNLSSNISLAGKSAAEVEAVEAWCERLLGVVGVKIGFE